jgi:hypothetical protein
MNAATRFRSLKAPVTTIGAIDDCQHCEKCLQERRSDVAMIGTRPLYRPDYDRVMRQYLTHRRAWHYDKMINLNRRVGWDDLTKFVDCGICAVLERQLSQARKATP